MNYDMFIKYCGNLSAQRLVQVLDYTIIPDDINEEAHNRFEAKKVCMTPTFQTNGDDFQLVSKSQVT